MALPEGGNMRATVIYNGMEDKPPDHLLQRHLGGTTSANRGKPDMTLRRL